MRATTPALPRQLMIVQVRAVPGAGKSWLCRRIKHCYDTDDIVARVYQKHGNVLGLSREYHREVQRIVNREHRLGRDAVFVGVTLKIPGVHQHYFMSITDKQMPQVYRRVMVREVRKMVAYSRVLKEIFETSPLKDVEEDVNSLVLPALDVRTTFDEYRDLYRRELDLATEIGATVASQTEIIADLQAMRRARFEAGVMGPVLPRKRGRKSDDELITQDADRSLDFITRHNDKRRRLEALAADGQNNMRRFDGLGPAPVRDLPPYGKADRIPPAAPRPRMTPRGPMARLVPDRSRANSADRTTPSGRLVRTKSDLFDYV